MTQGTPGREVLLILDGVTEISVDNEVVAEAGPGSILGERAALEGGLRTASVVATTPVRVAVTEAEELDPASLLEVARHHRREEG
jgi:CRP-like cAMP-binding protein